MPFNMQEFWFWSNVVALDLRQDKIDLATELGADFTVKIDKADSSQR